MYTQYTHCREIRLGEFTGSTVQQHILPQHPSVPYPHVQSKHGGG